MPVSFNPLARSVSGTEAPISNRTFQNGSRAQFSTSTTYPANHRFASFTGNAPNNTNAPKSNLWTTNQNRFVAYFDPANKEPRGSRELASLERKRILAKIKANEAVGKSYSIYDIRDTLHGSTDPADIAAGDVLNRMISNLVSSNNIDIGSMEFNAANLTAAAKSGEEAVHAMISSKINSTKGGRKTRRKRKAKKTRGRKH